MSKLLSSRNYVREKLGLAALPAGENEAASVPGDNEATEAAEAEKNEVSMIIILHNVRKKYKERGLVGSIDVSGSVGIFTTSVCCDINGEEDLTSDEVMLSSDGAHDIENLKRREKIVLSYLDGVLKTLERRAKTYQKLSFADDLTLTNGVYVCDPIFGTFTFSISMSASVQSLVNKLKTCHTLEATKP